ncbi:hypothetical protein Tco_1514729 [Tanacetum coccineum]
MGDHPLRQGMHIPLFSSLYCPLAYSSGVGLLTLALPGMVYQYITSSPDDHEPKAKEKITPQALTRATDRSDSIYSSSMRKLSEQCLHCFFHSIARDTSMHSHNEIARSILLTLRSETQTLDLTILLSFHDMLPRNGMRASDATVSAPASSYNSKFNLSRWWAVTVNNQILVTTLQYRYACEEL